VVKTSNEAKAQASTAARSVGFARRIVATFLLDEEDMRPNPYEIACQLTRFATIGTFYGIQHTK